MRLLPSVLTAGGASFPVWRMDQPARGASNSFVKSRASGVGVNSLVAVGAGVSVTGTDVSVGEAGIVAVGRSAASGVGVADWQAARNRKHIMRNFFMSLIKTQLPGALFQAIVFARRVDFFN